MQPLDDASLAGVTGQDGLAISVAGSSTSADEIGWITDAADPALESRLRLNDVNLTGVDEFGVTGGDYQLTSTLDVGGDGLGNAALAFALDLSRARLAIDSIRLNDDDVRSFGSLALDAEAELRLSNVNGLFDNEGANAALSGRISDGAIFYRQLWHEHPYLIMNDFQAAWEFEGGTLGLAPAADDPWGLGGGLRTYAPRIYVALQADIEYKFPVGLGEDSFTITGNEAPMLRFAWRGGLKDAELIWRGGGSWDGDGFASPSQGLNLGTRWNYVTNDEAVNQLGDPEAEFRWIFGEAGGGVQIELSDWVPWAGNEYGHNFPLIALDVVNPSQGPGGLCFGAANAGPLGGAASCPGAPLILSAGHIGRFDRQTYAANGSNAPGAAREDAPGMAVLVRDGNLLTYSRRVKQVQDGSLLREFDWGLIYTLANVDGNIYLYPGGNPSHDDQFGGNGGATSLDYGIIADILLMSQTLDGTGQQGDNWEQGTHFLLADSERGEGIGLINSSFLIGANDTRIWIKPQGSLIGGSSDFHEGGLDILSPQARINLRGTLGGGTIPNGNEIVQGARLNLNLEGLVNFRFSPSDPAGSSNHLGFSMAARLGDLDDAIFAMSEDAGNLASGQGTFFSAAEPSRPDVELRLGDIRGDIALTNGIIDLVGDGEMGDGRPALIISNNIQFGETANARLQDAVVGTTLPGGTAPRALVVNDLSFSGEHLGKLAVPSGQWGASITLKPQLP